jgi:hypothetical protein
VPITIWIAQKLATYLKHAPDLVHRLSCPRFTTTGYGVPVDYKVVGLTIKTQFTKIPQRKLPLILFAKTASGVCYGVLARIDSRHLKSFTWRKPEIIACATTNF